MIGDIVELKQHHFPPAQKIIAWARDSVKQSEQVFVFTVDGESGSGKSTLSLAMQKVMKKEGFNIFTFHIDDYFKLPPKDNHQQRETDLSNVGPQEVNLKLLQQHIIKIKEGADRLKKPLVHYQENSIRKEMVEIGDPDVVIVEGIYSSLLQHIDCRIFLERNYRDTFEDRAKRARDPILPIIEKVLEIEHNILKDHATMADILVDKNYNVCIKGDQHSG